jgi:CRP-like cAMP-binding protein
MVYRVGVKHLSRYLSEVDIFKGLSDRHLDRIAGLCEEWSFQAGEYLSIQNESGSRLYVIRRGEIEITTGHGDTRLMVRTVGEREAMPVAVLFEPPIMVTSARAATDGEALVIPRVGLMELCELEPRIGMHIYASVCGILMSRYRDTLVKLLDYASPAFHVGASWSGAEV